MPDTVIDHNEIDHDEDKKYKKTDSDQDASFVARVITIAQGARQEESFFSRLPMEVLAKIIAAVGKAESGKLAHRSEKNMNQMISLVLANVVQSPLGGLQWMKKLTRLNEDNASEEVEIFRNKSKPSPYPDELINDPNEYLGEISITKEYDQKFSL